MNYKHILMFFLALYASVGSLCCHAQKESYACKLYLVQMLRNPKVVAFLAMIAYAEGTDRLYGYYSQYPGKRLTSLSAHPRTVMAGRCAGKILRSSAAGRYQIIQRVWNTLEKRLDLRSFGPRDQDIAALELLREQGALDDLVKDRFESAVQKAGMVWASLPGSRHAHAHVLAPRTMKELHLVYRAALDLQ